MGNLFPKVAEYVQSKADPVSVGSGGIFNAVPPRLLPAGGGRLAPFREGTTDDDISRGWCFTVTSVNARNLKHLAFEGSRPGLGNLPHVVMEKFDPKTLRLGISVLLLIFLVVQTCASFGLFGWYGWRWPFMEYPMYTETFNKGDVVPVFALAGVTEDGTRIPLGAAEFNFDFWEYFNGPILAARGGDARRLRSFINPFTARTGIHLKSVQLMETPYVLSDNGVERRADELIATFDWETK